jgi:L-iditol 2-dehydrogenase
MIGVAKLAVGPGHVGLLEREEREPGVGQALLHVRAAGICGTDLHIEAAEYACEPPVTMGHEVCGTVAELGASVDAAWLGARVVTETYYSTCGRCALCLAGRPNLCLERRSIGTHVDGGFAPRVIVPAGNLHRVPEWLGDVAATLSEPLACVCHSLLDPTVVQDGDDVLVVGPGAIGLLAAQVARVCGGRVHVRGTARDGARLALARDLGFTTSVADSSDGPSAPADVVVECSGSGPGMAYGLTATRRAGRYVQIGLRGAPVTLPFDEVCFRELTITSGFASTPRSWADALELIHGGRLELAPLITDVLPLAAWEHAFAASRRGDGVKYALAPG